MVRWSLQSRLSLLDIKSEIILLLQILSIYVIMTNGIR